MKRVIEPEWLDSLPPDDARAIGSRRDLRRLNRVMNHAGILSRILLNTPSAPRRIVELGAGDGSLMLELALRLSPSWPKVEVVLLDCQEVIPETTSRKIAACGWRVEIVAADIFDFLKKPADIKSDIMLANLFLHHFADSQLRRMFALIAERTKRFVACEPRRSALPWLFSQFVGFIGCNAVTRKDAPISVRAGFAATELSTLWPVDPCWQLREHSARLFTHAFVAEATSEV